MGGIMTYHMLCALPNRIAAIASVSGPMSSSDVSGCNPGRPVPVMHMHGTADGTVPYDAGALPSLSLVPATMAFWQNNNSCADSMVYSLPNTVPADSITVDTIPFSNCNAPVILWRENGADHQWLYKPVNDVDATTQIWLFFRDKVHPGPSQLGIENSGNSTITSIQYIASAIEIESKTPIQQAGIYDLRGSVLIEINGKDQTHLTIDLHTIPSQAIIVKVMSGGNVQVKKLVHIQ
jgi:polyhydroxybutyrate depolymerase